MIGPEQAGIADTTGADTASGLPQLSLTTGGVGADAAPGQATVEDPGAGIVVTVGGRTVVVCTHVYVAPAQSV